MSAYPEWVLLPAPQTHVPELVMDFYSPWNVALSCDLQAGSQRNRVFNCLGASIP